MIFTRQWICEWLDSVPASETLIHQLTMAGLEVDAHGPVAADFSEVIVGEVIDVQPHPDADRLRVCRVNDGAQVLQVVCGAPNVRPGLKVPYATIGAELPINDPEPGKASSFKIKKAKLRGVESHGMLCSAAELGLSDAADGLMELPCEAPTGDNLRDYLQLDDQYFELDLTPNRGDCLSIRGLAREVAVLNELPFTEPKQQSVPAAISDTFPVNIQAAAACPRYLGRVIRGIDSRAETPLWMQEKLRRCGLRSIDPVVDITNYVLLELGQPMHAFDLQQLQGGIDVRMAEQGDELTLLDGKTIQAEEDTLLICDASGPLALAGIMGGEHSGVTGETRDVFLECAYFSPLAIAGRARRYGLHTDASHRYERGVDPALQPRAMERATELLLAICGGQPGPVMEQKGELPEERTVSLRPAKLASTLGARLGDDTVINILQRLGLSLLSRSEESFEFQIPAFRFDITIEADLIEEVARIYGYDNIPVARPMAGMRINSQPESRVTPGRLRDKLVTLGYQQIISYSFVEPAFMAQIQAEPRPVALQNPLSTDLSVMRTSLWPGLITALKHNINRQQTRLRLFETGQVFLCQQDGISQPEKLAGLLYGSRYPQEWSQNADSVDFYDLKGDVEVLLGTTGRLSDCGFESSDHPALHPGQSARIILDGREIGLLGALAPRLQRELDLTEQAFVFELDLETLLTAVTPAFTPLSRYPEVSRDLAIVVDDAVPVGNIHTCLRELAGEYLVDLRIFDVYQGDAVGKNKKSVAMGLTWQHPSRTLGDDDINIIINRCVKGLEEKFNAKLRN